MRLIDADKLVELCRKGWKLFGREDEKLKHWVDEDDIRNQPTVKAIPIEWIEEWLDKFQERNGYRNIIAPKSITIRDTTIILPCVSDMLKDWEKENV